MHPYMRADRVQKIALALQFTIVILATAYISRFHYNLTVPYPLAVLLGCSPFMVGWIGEIANSSLNEQSGKALATQLREFIVVLAFFLITMIIFSGKTEEFPLFALPAALAIPYLVLIPGKR